MPTVREAFTYATQVAKGNRLRPRSLRVLAETQKVFERIYGPDTEIPVDTSILKAALSHLAPASLNKHLRQYKRVCRLSGLNVKVEQLRVPRKRPDVLTDAELARLFDAAPPRLRPLLLFVADSGCRRSEAATLEWHQVDLERGEVTLTDAKSGSDRVVPLSARVVEALKLLPRGRYVFRAIPRRDAPFSVNGLTNAINSIFKHAGLTKRRRGLHTLRRTFATRAAMNGIPMPVLMSIGGWSQISTVSNYYIAVSEEAKRAAIEKLSNGNC